MGRGASNCCYITNLVNLGLFILYICFFLFFLLSCYDINEITDLSKFNLRRLCHQWILKRRWTIPFLCQFLYFEKPETMHLKERCLPFATNSMIRITTKKAQFCSLFAGGTCIEMEKSGNNSPIFRVACLVSKTSQTRMKSKGCAFAFSGAVAFPRPSAPGCSS